MSDNATLWTVIIGLGVGSFLLRLSFQGLVGDRPLTECLLRHLRYTAVAILPALVAPLVVYSGENGSTDITRVVAALATLGVGMWTRNVFAAIGAGAVTLVVLVYGFG